MSPGRHKLKTLTRSHVLVLVGSAAAVLFLVGSVLWAQLGQQAAQQQTGVVEQQRDEAARTAQELADQIKAACQSGVLHGPVCEQAEDVAATPPPIPGPAGPPPTSEQIQAAVDAYLVAHPPPAGRSPSAVEVAAAVASYLTANPPAPGRGPTAEEIAAAVEEYFVRNPPPAGPPGEDGEPGRPPTAAEIRAAVDEYLAANPPPAGEQGETGSQGVQGVSVQDIRTEGSGSDCALVFSLFDPATGETSERSVPVASGVCDEPVLPGAGG